MTQLQVNETQHLPLSLSYHDPLTHMLTASCLPSGTNSVRVLPIPSLLGIAADHDPLTHMLTASCLPSGTNSVRVLPIPSLLTHMLTASCLHLEQILSESCQFLHF